MSIQRRVREATGVNILKPVYYSAQYSWNIDKLFDFIIDNMPTCRRSLFLNNSIFCSVPVPVIIKLFYYSFMGITVVIKTKNV